jgi:hypothetical protein
LGEIIRKGKTSRCAGNRPLPPYFRSARDFLETDALVRLGEPNESQTRHFSAT